MSTIAAGTTSTTALVSTGDTTGKLVLQTNGTTTAMTIDTSQNVGIGTSSPGSILELKAATPVLQINGTTAASARGIAFQDNGVTRGSLTHNANSGATTLSSGDAGNGYFITFKTDATERMRIDSSGNVGIGTSSPSNKLDVVGGNGNAIRSNNAGAQYSGFEIANNGTNKVTLQYDNTNGLAALNTRGSNPLTFGTADTERMRIDSSGNLLVGTTSQNLSGRIFNVYGSGVLGSFYRNTSTSDDEVFEVRSNVGSTNTQTLKITANGNVTNTNGSYGSYSDIKLKENIVDATPKLEDLMRVRVRNYNLKNNPDQKLLGVVAQELEEVFPNLVEESTDYDNDGNDLGTITKGVKYSIFVPMLIKAIQELKAENDALKSRLDAVEALEARIAALEAK